MILQRSVSILCCDLKLLHILLVLHDYLTSINIITYQGMTEYRQAGHCFLLSNGFGETFSTNMDDWYEVNIS